MKMACGGRSILEAIAPLHLKRVAKGIVFLGLTTVISAPAASVPEFDATDTAAFIQVEADQDRFSGTVLVAKDGVQIFTAAHGYASLDYHVPNRLDTKFNLGSMNKMLRPSRWRSSSKRACYHSMTGS